MINILHNTVNIDEDWCFDAFSKYIKKGSKVVIVAFSYNDQNIRNRDDWNKYYQPQTGYYYNGMVDAFKRFAINESDIRWINYFEDDIEASQEKIASADIIYFPGGLPDSMMNKIIEKDLVDVIKNHQGIVMGFSAGALIQLSEYHITPDEDYDEFLYERGLTLIDGFYIEVHYENTLEQKISIKKVIGEKGKLVYGIGDKGALIVHDQELEIIGDVTCFT